VAIHWTPDGERLVYAVDEGPNDEPHEFWMISVAGGEPERLSLDMTIGQFSGLEFRPDGRAVAFTNEERIQELWLMDGLDW
jgi:Tol biopolymer transport system component